MSIPSKTIQNLSFLPVSSVSYLSEIDVPPLNLTIVTEEVVISAICNLKLDPKKVTGCDRLPNRFIKTCPEAMGRLLTVLVDKSTLTGKFPKLWKSAIVSPVQKSKNSSELTNFRPISDLPAFSKILERVICDQLISHFLNFNQLSDFQSGFRASHSPQDVLLHVVDDWRRAIDDGKFIAAGFLDLAKAFDCVNHSILLSKLKQYGVMGSASLWFESYLCDRQQCVSFQGNLSEWGAISVGVPQGSILGLLLFSIFANDLPRVVSYSQINLYADDTELHCCGRNLSSVQHDFQYDLGAIQVWLCVHEKM